MTKDPGFTDYARGYDHGTRGFAPDAFANLDYLSGHGHGIADRHAASRIKIRWSPDFDAYATGKLPISAIRCALCGLAPCQCPPFGTPEYFALIDRVHGRDRNA
jgi:hypothetical protein